MTACTNKGGKAGRVITAALVATLSVGAPVVALATTADAATGDIELMATDADAFSAGTVNYKDGKAGDSFVYNGKNQGLVPESVTPYNSTDEVVIDGMAESATPQGDGNYYYYVLVSDSGTAVDGVEYVNSKGKKVELKGAAVYSDSSYAAVGTYAVVVGQYDAEESSWNYVSVADTFKITAADLSAAELCDADDADSVTFSTYSAKTDGELWKNVKAAMGVQIDGTLLDTNKYAVTAIEKGKTTQLGDNDALVPGTTYVVKIEGKADYAGKSKEIEFTYSALDLSKASVVGLDATKDVNDISTSLDKVMKTVNDEDLSALSALAGHVDVTLSKTPDGSSYVSAKGEYVFTIAGKKDDKYVTGSVSVSRILANQIANIEYDGDEFPESMNIDLFDPEYFDVSKITVEDENGKKVSDFKVTVTDKDGNAATEADLKKAGTWKVTVTVNTTNDDGDVIAASKTCTVKNEYSAVDDANVYVSFDGRNIAQNGTDNKAVFNGEDQLEKLSVKVVKGDKTLEAGTDYEVKVTRTVDGKDVDVDEMVDAGTYKVTVKGLTFTPDNAQTFTIEVQKLELTTIEPSDPIATEIAYVNNYGYVNRYYLNYTGEELTPTYTFKDAKGNEWVLDADEYEVKYDKKTLKDEGTYNIQDVTVKSDNFKASQDGIKLPVPTPAVKAEIVVTSNRTFVDVPNDAWYASAVATAKQQGYINGVNNSNVFAPEASINRADVVCVLYRMAGGTIENGEDWVGGDNANSYLSKFSDVDGKAYYAEALVWATKVGVVTGYEDGTFRPGSAVTAEEFATMLARYAKIAGTDTSVEDVDAVLGEVADGAQVSDFARDAVAWAVDGGYLAQGSDIVPQSEVSRGRMITIAVRYQPEQADLL